MSVYEGRKWLIVVSLVVALAVFCTFLLLPVVGYPLRFSQAQSVVQIVLPVFLGYLGAATQFVFQKSPAADDAIEARPLMSLLIKAPIGVFVVAMVVIVFAFGYSNRAAATAGDGMSIDQLTFWVTLVMGLLAVTTNSVVAYLFNVEKKAVRKPKGKA